MLNSDILVVGGGCVGLTAALGLTQHGYKVVVIDKAGDITELSEPEMRVSAISPASETIFRNLDVWRKLTSERLTPYRYMSVWDKDSFGNINFDSSDVGESRLGHIIENNNIRNALVAKAQEHENIQLKFEAEISAIHNSPEQVLVTLNDGTPVMAKLLIAADGAQSYVRKQLNIGIQFNDYEHNALVATVKTSLPHGHNARQVFLPEGPLALLPLYQNDLCSIVWSARPERNQELISMTDEAFNRAITAATDSVLGPISVQSQRASYPLTMRYANDWLVDRVVLMGDAAHTIHPLAGLGMNLGLLDAASLAEVLSELDGLEDPKLHSKLRHYERWRKAQAQEHIAAMAGLKSLFAGDAPVKKLVRSIGLKLTDQISPVKNTVIRHAMGLTGDLPSLAKPELK